MMCILALSSTEVELNSVVLEAMGIMMAYHVLRGMTLLVELPLKLYVNNRGAVELANSWSIGGQSTHVGVGVKTNWLRSLKEMGVLIVLYKNGTELIPDIGTKNVTMKEYIHKKNKFMHPKMLGERKGVWFEADTQQQQQG